MTIFTLLSKSLIFCQTSVFNLFLTVLFLTIPNISYFICKHFGFGFILKGSFICIVGRAYVFFQSWGHCIVLCVTDQIMLIPTAIRWSLTYAGNCMFIPHVPSPHQMLFYFNHFPPPPLESCWFLSLTLFQD